MTAPEARGDRDFQITMIQETLIPNNLRTENRQQSAQATVDIGETGPAFAIEAFGDTDISFVVDADEPLELEIDTGTDPEAPEQQGVEGYDGETITDAFTLVSRWLVFRVAEPATGEATITVEATR